MPRNRCHGHLQREIFAYDLLSGFCVSSTSLDFSEQLATLSNVRAHSPGVLELKRKGLPGTREISHSVARVGYGSSQVLSTSVSV
jgi:hypothetical protein